MRIDESGTDYQAGSVNRFSRAVFNLADLGDFALTYRQVSAIAGTAGSINDRPIFYYNVVRHTQMPPRLEKRLYV
jgi:hypothetical protein